MSRGNRLVSAIITQLQAATPRFQGPLSILWDIVVDTLDPMATTASGSQASMTPQDCQAIAHIKQSLNPGELPSAVALDTSAPNCAMRHIFAELRSLSV